MHIIALNKNKYYMQQTKNKVIGTMPKKSDFIKKYGANWWYYYRLEVIRFNIQMFNKLKK